MRKIQLEPNDRILMWGTYLNQHGCGVILRLGGGGGLRHLVIVVVEGGQIDEGRLILLLFDGDLGRRKIGMSHRSGGGDGLGLGGARGGGVARGGRAPGVTFEMPGVSPARGCRGWGVQIFYSNTNSLSFSTTISSSSDFTYFSLEEIRLSDSKSSIA